MMRIKGHTVAQNETHGRHGAIVSIMVSGRILGSLCLFAHHTQGKSLQRGLWRCNNMQYDGRSIQVPRALNVRRFGTLERRALHASIMPSCISCIPAARRPPEAGFSSREEAAAAATSLNAVGTGSSSTTDSGSSVLRFPAETRRLDMVRDRLVITCDKNE